MKDLFSTALARLTTLYVVVLAVVCLLFSSFIYALASNEIEQTSRRQVVGFRGALGRFIIDERESEKMRQEEASSAKARLKTKLVFGNLAVIAVGAVLSYQFARRTLRPIEQNARAQERFTSDASHELRTPLASMRTEIEVALRDKNLSAKEARELLASNLEEVQNLQTITDNLLALARTKEIKEKKQINIDKLLHDVVKKYSKQIKQQSMTYSVDAKHIRHTTNPTALRQVVSILVENSTKYSGEKTKLLLRGFHENDRLIIEVEDNGIGLAGNQLETVFERFFKVDDSRSNSRVAGHGLGLSIARQLIESMGGSIVALQPENGKGVVFRLEID